MGLKLRHVDSTETGGSSYLVHVGHAAEAIAAGKCQVALITLAGRPRSRGLATGTAPRAAAARTSAEAAFENALRRRPRRTCTRMCAMRHMHEYGTTSEQLAWIKVAASHHAQCNPHAMLRDVVTVEDVLNSPMIADPLHRLDCCVITDGGGAVIVAAPEIAQEPASGRWSRSSAPARRSSTRCGGTIDLDLLRRGAGPGRRPSPRPGVTPADIKYASIYDSFTITVLMQLEDLGFCEKGEGGRFVADGNLISGIGKLPFNTDGGGLCNNHPANRGGMTKVIEAVRQLRGEAHPAGAGAELRAGARARHRRLARHPPRQRHR